MLAQETLDLVSDVVMGQRVSGQPPVTLATEKLTLEVFKDEPGSVAGRTITADTGSFQLPNASSLFGDTGETQVGQIVRLHTQYNPLMSFMQLSLFIRKYILITGSSYHCKKPPVSSFITVFHQAPSLVLFFSRSVLMIFITARNLCRLC